MPTPQRILVLLFGDLGDTVLTVPALRAVRTRYPRARITLVGKRLPGRIAADLGLVDHVIEVDKHLFDSPRGLLRPSNWLAAARVGYAIKRERADTVALFHHLVTRWGSAKFAAVALWSGASRRVGIDNGRGWFLTDRVRDRGFGAVHESEYYLEVASLLDAHDHRGLEAPVTERDRAEVRHLLRERGVTAPLLVIHPGTGWYGPGRRWPADRFGQAALQVLEAQAVSVVVVGTAEDAPQVEAVMAILGDRGINLMGQTSLGQLGALLEQADVVVANDGGVGHLASAVGTPVLSLFGPSNDRAWAPLTATVIAADLPCRPCFYRGFDRGLPAGCATRECLFAITPERVSHEILAALERTRASV